MASTVKQCTYFVFVYGTLKRNEPNFQLMKDTVDKRQAIFIGTASTVDPWPLIVYKPFNVPFLLDSKGQGKHVFGEVYKINTDGLKLLDELEGHPLHYTRDLLEVKLEDELEDNSSLKNGQIIECNAYFIRNFHKEVLTTEAFLESYTDHADCRYIPRKDRPSNDFSDILLKESASSNNQTSMS